MFRRSATATKLYTSDNLQKDALSIFSSQGRGIGGRRDERRGARQWRAHKDVREWIRVPAGTTAEAGREVG